VLATAMQSRSRACWGAYRRSSIRGLWRHLCSRDWLLLVDRSTPRSWVSDLLDIAISRGYIHLSIDSSGCYITYPS